MDGLSFDTSLTFTYGVATPVAPGIRRIVAPNPGPFTFKGTNTYLVGETALAVIDPGPANPEHLAAILNAANGRPITHIISTHAHRDHVDAIPALRQATGARVCAMTRKGAVRLALEQTPQGREYIDFDLKPDEDLCEGAEINGDDWSLRALHTPGHAPDHLCFLHAQSGALFSGDHVMAWNTTIVAPPEGNMAHYIASLERLLTVDTPVYLSGHGGPIEDAQRRVRAYLLHRQWREQAILKAIQDGAQTLTSLVPVIYPQIVPTLIPAAMLTLLAHVEWLVAKGRVAADGPLTADRQLRAV